MAALAFHPNQPNTTGEGGMIVTDDRTIGRVVNRELRIVKPEAVFHSSLFTLHYSFFTIHYSEGGS